MSSIYRPTITTRTPTFTSLPSLTTPFVTGRLCSNAKNFLSFVTTSGYYYPYTTTSVAVFLDPANSAYSQCQPSGWKYMPSVQQWFTPAVCPSGWDMHSVYSTTFESKVLTTAHCCERYHSILWSASFGPLASLGTMCLSDGYALKWITVTDRGTVKTTSLSRAYDLQPAWHIAWSSKDLTALSPRPPAITGTTTIRSWYTNSYSSYEPYKPPRTISPVTIGLLAGGLPILVCLGLYFFMRCRSKRAKSKEEIFVAEDPEPEEDAEIAVRENVQGNGTNNEDSPPVYSLNPL